MVFLPKVSVCLHAHKKPVYLSHTGNWTMCLFVIVVVGGSLKDESICVLLQAFLLLFTAAPAAEQTPERTNG